MPNWDRIIERIEQDSCVLILGDGIPLSDGKPLAKGLRKHLEEKDYDAKVYEGDFFYFKNPVEEGDAYFDIRSFFKEQNIPDYLQKLAEIPFHLYVQLSPDDFLKQAFAGFGQGRTAFYDKSLGVQSLDNDLDEPTGETPIIYQLLGTVDKDESLVFTYGRLFEYMSKVLGEKPLPSIVRTALNTAKYFIFIGFSFEKWHLKLFVHLLKERNVSARLEAFTDTISNEVHDFYNDHFGISFIEGENLSFIDKLHEKSAEKGILRNLATHQANANKRVFISYNHKDKEFAHKIKECLEKEEGISVTIDAEVMQAGEPIKDFIMRAMSETDVTLSLVSENSLLSAWVAMESVNSISDAAIRGRQFIPAAITQQFFEPSFVRESITSIDARIEAIGKEIVACLSSGIGIDHLQDELSRNNQLKANLPSIVQRFKESLTLDISGEDFETGMHKIIATIKGK